MTDEQAWDRLTNKIRVLFDRNEELEKENEVLQRHFEEGQDRIEKLQEEIELNELLIKTP